MRIGTVHLNRSQPVLISPDDLLGKHFAILGTTGCGKSCAVSLILQRILETHANAHVLLLDPHNEYPRAFAGQAEILGPDSLQLPYWLLTSDEIASVIVGNKPQSRDRAAVIAILNELIPIAKASFQRERPSGLHITVDTPVPYRLTDVTRLLDVAMGRLEKPESLAPYRWLKTRLEVLTANSRFAFMFGGISVQDNMVRILSRLFRIPVDGKPVTIIDLSGVPSEVLNVVVSVLCRTTFDFALWSRGAQPILLVCEEAHRYAPGQSGARLRADQGGARPNRQGRPQVRRLALYRQPAALGAGADHPLPVQHDLRLPHDQPARSGDRPRAHDRHGIRAVGFPALARRRRSDRGGRGRGAAAAHPVDHLPPDRQPQSGTARFSKSWQGDCQDESFVTEVVERWRRQQR